MSENKTPLAENEELSSKTSDEQAKDCESVKEEKVNPKREKRPKKAKKAKKGKKAKDGEAEEKEQTEEEKEKKKKKANDKPKDAKGSARRLIGYITKQKFWLFIVAVLVILSTIVSVASSLIMQPVYQSIEDVIKRHADPNAAFSKIVQALVIMSVAYLISAIMSYAYTRIMLTVSVKTLTNMRRDLFNHMQGLALEFFDKRRTGEIMSHFTNDVGRVSDLVQSTFTNLISSTIQAVMTITIMIIYSWQITLTITVAIVLMFAVVF